MRLDKDLILLSIPEKEIRLWKIDLSTYMIQIARY